MYSKYVRITRGTDETCRLLSCIPDPRIEDLWLWGFRNVFSFLKKDLFNFWAGLGLCCCPWACSSCGEQGLSSLWSGAGALGHVGSGAAAHRWSCSAACGIWNLVPCIVWQILNHWPTREAQFFFLTEV